MCRSDACRRSSQEFIYDYYTKLLFCYDYVQLWNLVNVESIGSFMNICNDLGTLYADVWRWTYNYIRRHYHIHLGSLWPHLQWVNCC